MIKRNTIQCSLVFEAVNKLNCHATADEIYTSIIQEHSNISRATVYRNLNQLSKIDKIRKIEIPGGADCFDHQCYDHYHTRCEKCAKIFDVDMEYIVDFEKNIKNPRGFQFTGYDIVFKSICPKCKK
ncbi:MAG: transcriptional repressor [Candidatus Niameybacter stercoravium]|nr:transcriptional repressor [Candidatus Niameybacter stercoravium]